MKVKIMSSKITAKEEKIVGLVNSFGKKFPNDFSVKLVSLNVANVLVGFDCKKYADRFYFLNSLNNSDLLSHEQKKALQAFVKTVDRKADKVVSHTEVKDVVETRIVENDILSTCTDLKDCYHAIHAVLKKVGLRKENENVFEYTALESYRKVYAIKIDEMIEDQSFFTSPVKNQRAIFSAQETFTADDKLESLTPQILDKELNTMH